MSGPAAPCSACIQADSTEQRKAAPEGAARLPGKLGAAPGRRAALGRKEPCARSEDRVRDVRLVDDLANLLATVVADQHVPDLLRLVRVEAHARVKTSVVTALHAVRHPCRSSCMPESTIRVRRKPALRL